MSIVALAVCLAVVGCGGTPSSPTPRPRPPQLLCPASLSVTGVTGNSQSVTYPAPVLASGSTPVTIACSPVSGSTFPTGSTLVTCTATDAYSQVGTCSFSVTLTALTLQAVKFVAFGDSVTAGENSLPAPGGYSRLVVDVANSYPTKLQSALQRDFPAQGATVVNEGLPGERAAVAIERLEDVLRQHDPDALLLLDGYNDLLAGGVSAAETVADALREMVRVARLEGVTHIFVSTLTPGRSGSREVNPSAILQTNTLIRLMAVSEGVVLVDNFNTFVGREATLVSGDGLHLTAAGNQVLADTFLAAIRSAAASGVGPYRLYVAPPGSVER